MSARLSPHTPPQAIRQRYYPPNARSGHVPYRIVTHIPDESRSALWREHLAEEDQALMEDIYRHKLSIRESAARRGLTNVAVARWHRRIVERLQLLTPTREPLTHHQRELATSALDRVWLAFRRLRRQCPRQCLDADEYISTGHQALVDAAAAFTRHETDMPFGLFAYLRIRWAMWSLFAQQFGQRRPQGHFTYTTRARTDLVDDVDVFEDRSAPVDDAVGNAIVSERVRDVPLAEDDRAMFDALYNGRGLTITEYADELGLSYNCIRAHHEAVVQQLRVALGVAPCGAAAAPLEWMPHKSVPKHRRAHLLPQIAALTAEGRPRKEIAAILGMPPSSVGHIRERNNLRTRTNTSIPKEEVIALRAGGLTAPQIAKRLKLNPRSVSNGLRMWLGPVDVQVARAREGHVSA